MADAFFNKKNGGIIVGMSHTTGGDSGCSQHVGEIVQNADGGYELIAAYCQECERLEHTIGRYPTLKAAKEAVYELYYTTQRGEYITLPGGMRFMREIVIDRMAADAAHFNEERKDELDKYVAAHGSERGFLGKPNRVIMSEYLITRKRKKPQLIVDYSKFGKGAVEASLRFIDGEFLIVASDIISTGDRIPPAVTKIRINELLSDFYHSAQAKAKRIGYIGGT